MLRNAWQNINLPVCGVGVSVCVHVRHTFCQLAYRSDPSTARCFTVDNLKDAYLRKDVHFGGLDDE